jgi:external thioesterase TEII
MKKAQLFLLHFAGGNSYSFQFMLPFLESFDVVPLELPGRGRRVKETLLTDFDLAVTDYYQQVQARMTGEPFIIYGHSMGAALALRLANRLIRNKKSPVSIVVSGNAGPGVRHTNDMYLLEQQEFIAELRKLGGLPDELIDSEELLHFFMPILRADFQVCEINNLGDDDKIDVPIYAIMGDKEEEAKKIANWARFTSSHFYHEILPGGHFFIHHHPQKIAYAIRHMYDNVISLQHQLD